MVREDGVILQYFVNNGQKNKEWSMDFSYGRRRERNENEIHLVPLDFRIVFVQGNYVIKNTEDRG